MKQLIVILIFLIGYGSVAQTPKERIKSLKTAYLTKELSLTKQEAKTFWPIYNVYETEIEESRRKQARKILEQSEDIDQMNEAQATQLIEDYMKVEMALYSAQDNLIKSLKGILSPQRIAKLLIAERKFNQRMLQRFRARMGN